MNTLTTETRREKIKEMLQKTDHPVTASSLAEHFSVSRQIIVGDIALLRASGLQILATPRGYLMDSPSVQEDEKRLGMMAYPPYSGAASGRTIHHRRWWRHSR